MMLLPVGEVRGRILIIALFFSSYPARGKWGLRWMVYPLLFFLYFFYFLVGG